MRANSLAPGRFAWRKYPAQINIETVRKRLWDARRPDVGGLVTGSEKAGWALTERGLGVARELASRLEGVDLSRDRASLAERRWRAAERRRLLGSEAFDKLCHSGENAVNRREAEAFFRLDEYVTGERRERKVVRILDAFSQDPELGRAVRLLATKVRGGNRQ